MIYKTINVIVFRWNPLFQGLLQSFNGVCVVLALFMFSLHLQHRSQADMPHSFWMAVNAVLDHVTTPDQTEYGAPINTAGHRTWLFNALPISGTELFCLKPPSFRPLVLLIRVVLRCRLRYKTCHGATLSTTTNPIFLSTCNKISWQCSSAWHITENTPALLPLSNHFILHVHNVPKAISFKMLRMCKIKTDINTVQGNT